MEAVDPRPRSHPDFTKELPRKLLPTRAKETQARRRESRLLNRLCYKAL